MVHQTRRRITIAVEIYDEWTLSWKHTYTFFSGHGAGMNVSSKDVYHDQFNNSNIHSIKIARSARNNISESFVCKKNSNIKKSVVKCVRHRKWPQDRTPSWAVHLSSRSIKKWRDRDTLANQNSSDTNMQSCTSTESPVFLSILSNISCGYVVNNKFLVKEKGVPPLVFSRFGKMTPENNRMYIK